MPEYKTPGVYVEELANSPTSVAQVETAVPAFIGYTQKAEKNTPLDLILQPTRIYSVLEFEQHYGGPDLENDPVEMTVADAPGGGFKTVQFKEPALDYLLYYSLQLFFDNGGTQCYIVSVGTYQSAAVIDLRGDAGSSDATRFGLSDGLDALKTQDEVTLIVIPEAVNLSRGDYQSMVQAVLLQCQALQDRFAIFDLHGGDTVLNSSALQAARGLFGSNYLEYAAAYYPFLKTTLNFYISATADNVKVTYGSFTQVNPGTFESTNSALYTFVKNTIRDHFVVLPASPAVTGIYAATDSNRGVWKAPANVSLSSVIEPIVKIDDSYQERLNIDAGSGKSINAIRYFAGKGTLVWGARTLAGNDNEWRYVPVRRFFNMVQESVKKSTAWVVFEPNDANIWQRVTQLLESYLFQLWRNGALAGTKPEDAFFVRCGLGSTMTAQDILEGRLTVEIGMAPVRPAEFIVLRFTHRLVPA